MRCCTRLKPFLFSLMLVFALSFDVAFAASDIVNTPPADPPFLGGYYITGYDATVGNCTIYVPTGEGWCLDEYGFLFRCSNSSTSGVMYAENGTEYTFSASGYSVPRFRPASGSSYNYTDLRFNPSASNALISDSFAPVYDSSYMISLITLAVLGLILVVNLTHRR